MVNNLIKYRYEGSQSVERMPRHARAAQFSPFAALTGYDELIEDSSRITYERGEVSEDRAEHINECLRIIFESYPQRIRARITYFAPDKKKHGGNYRELEGLVRQIDAGEMKVVFEDNRAVSIGDIFDIVL